MANFEMESVPPSLELSSPELLDEVDKVDEVDEVDEVDKVIDGEAIEVWTEKIDGRQRKITATIHIPHAVENVWTVLTDYEGLADFIPNLKKSQRIDHPEQGIRIEQIGSESLLKLKFCARVVLDMVEQFPHRLRFEMVEGDFRQFSGEWQLQPSRTGTNLTYIVNIAPSRLMPVGMIERRLSKGLQANLSSIKQRVNELFS